MKHSTAARALVAPVLLATAIAGCSAGTNNPATPKSGAAKGSGGAAAIKLTTLTPAATSEVDKVTWNVYGGEPQSINPFVSADFRPNQIVSNMCETLLAAGPDFAIKPNLATPSNPDPLHWVYTIKSGVKFWDGTPMTAEDVAFSLNHNLKDKTTLYNYLFANVKSIATTGSDKVTVTLTKPDYNFNDEMASFAGVVVQKKFFEAHAKDFGSPSTGVMCTGPYKFGAWKKGQSITALKNTAYWNKALIPKVGTLTFTFLINDASILAGLRTGQIDGAYNLPQNGIKQLQQTSSGKLYFGPTQLNTTMLFSNPSGALGNLKVRQALQGAIDWDGIVKTVYNGGATPLRGNAPDSMFGTDKKVLSDAYAKLPAVKSGDVAGGKKLVAEAGAVAKKKITLAIPDDSNAQNWGLAIESAAKSIGLNFALKVIPTDQYANYLFDPKTRAGIDALYVVYWPNTPTLMDWFASTATKGAAFNPYSYSGIDSLYAKAQATADPSARAAVLAQIQTKLRNELLPMAPGISPANTLWMNNRITGAPASFDYVYYPWAATLGGTK